uniref:Uncharacterized protein n=1 Tax=Zosterops lateralis melanops TaxID=1220523 RepID=A0A8D2QV51_ZOSLA
MAWVLCWRWHSQTCSGPLEGEREQRQHEPGWRGDASRATTSTVGTQFWGLGACSYSPAEAVGSQAMPGLHRAVHARGTSVGQDRIAVSPGLPIGTANTLRLPICTCSIYQPWGSSYSYSSAPRELPSSTWAASSPAWTPALGSVSSLTISQRQCMLCCPIFPAPWLLKTQIQHSSQEGYSCTGFYRRPEVLGEAGFQGTGGCSPRGLCSPSSQAATTGGHCSITPASKQNELFQEQSASCL